VPGAAAGSRACFPYLAPPIWHHGTVPAPVTAKRKAWHRVAGVCDHTSGAAIPGPDGDYPMRTPIIAALVVVLAAAAGGGYYALEVYPQQRFRTGLDQALATLPPGTTGSYKTAHYSVASHRAVVTGFTVHGEINAARPHPFDVTIDSIETENPALNFPDLWADAVAKPAALTPDTALPVADAVIVKGLTIHSDMVNISQASIHITKTRLFPWALLHDGMPSWQEIQASLTPPSDPARIADLRPLLRAEAAALLGIAYDSYEAGAVKASETSPREGLSSPTTLTGVNVTPPSVEYAAQR